MAENLKTPIISRNRPNLKQVYRDICLGYSTAAINGSLVYFRHFDSLVLAELESYQFEKIQEFKKKGALTTEERMEELLKSGIWSKKKDDEIYKLKLDLMVFADTKGKAMIEEQIEEIDREIEIYKKKIEEVTEEKNRFLGLTAERMATKSTNDKALYISSFKNKELTESFFENEEEFDYLEPENYTALTNSYFSSLEAFSVENIKLIACSAFFYNFFSIIKSPIDFFGKRGFELTNPQVDLLNWGGYFKEILPECHDMPDEDKGIPEKIEQWFIIKKNGGNNTEVEEANFRNKFKNLPGI